MTYYLDPWSIKDTTNTTTRLFDVLIFRSGALYLRFETNPVIPLHTLLHTI